MGWSSPAAWADPDSGDLAVGLWIPDIHTYKYSNTNTKTITTVQSGHAYMRICGIQEQ